MNSITKNYAILFLVLMVTGLICILKSYDIGRYFVLYYSDGWSMQQEILGAAAWIAFGGVVSLLSGYGLIKIILKYIG